MRICNELDGSGMQLTKLLDLPRVVREETSRCEVCEVHGLWQSRGVVREETSRCEVCEVHGLWQSRGHALLSLRSDVCLRRVPCGELDIF